MTKFIDVFIRRITFSNYFKQSIKAFLLTYHMKIMEEIFKIALPILISIRSLKQQKFVTCTTCIGSPSLNRPRNMMFCSNQWILQQLVVAPPHDVANKYYSRQAQQQSILYWYQSSTIFIFFSFSSNYFEGKKTKEEDKEDDDISRISRSLGSNTKKIDAGRKQVQREIW